MKIDLATIDKFKKSFYAKGIKFGDCFLWNGYVSKIGYGSVSFLGKPSCVHRISYLLTHGEILKEYVVRHTCHNKTCFNPEHLILGTNSDNIIDSIIDNKILNKLKVEEVFLILNDINRNIPIANIAKNHSVSRSVIYDIKSGRTWCYITGIKHKLHSKSQTLYPLEHYREKLYSNLVKKDNCLLWRGSFKNGYGIINVNGRTKSTHRLSYELNFGPISNGMVVRHICSNTSCINPEHLILGTQKDNAIDMVLAGNCKKSIFSIDEIKEIKHLHKTGMTSAEIANQINQPISRISKIITGSRYGYII